MRVPTIYVLNKFHLELAIFYRRKKSQYCIGVLQWLYGMQTALGDKNCHNIDHLLQNSEKKNHLSDNPFCNYILNDLLLCVITECTIPISYMQIFKNKLCLLIIHFKLAVL